MGIPVLILGESGTGKSYALRNIAEHAAIINVLNKPLPFRSAGVKTASSRDIAKVRKWFNATFPNYSKLPEFNDDNKVLVTPTGHDAKSLKEVA